MVKIISSFFSIFMLMASQWTCAEIRPLKSSSKELRVGIPADYAPLAFYDKTGALTGFDVDMAKSLGKWLHRNVRFVATSWSDLPNDLATNKFDIAMGGITYSSERNNKFALSDPVIQNGKIALTNCAQIKKYRTLEDIDCPGVRVIVNPGGTNQSYVKDYIKQAQIIYTKDNFANLQALRDSNADIMFTDLIEGNYYQQKEPGVFCIATKEILPGTKSFKVYMMPKDNRLLLKEVNAWLKKDKRDLLRHWQIPD